MQVYFKGDSEMKKIVIVILLSLLFVNPSWAGIYFDDVDDYVVCGTSLTLESSPFSVSIWINQNSPGNFSRVICKDNGIGNAVWTLNNHSDGRYYFDVFNTLNTSFNTYDASVDTLSANGSWTHFVLTFDGTNVSIYKNSVLKKTNNSFTGTLNTEPTVNMTIGGSQSGCWEGWITEVAYWNVTLTQTEIDLLFNSKIKGIPLQIRPSNLKGYWSMDEGTSGNSADLDTCWDLSGNGNNGNPDNGGNNTGLTWIGESVLSYPPSPMAQ